MAWNSKITVYNIPLVSCGFYAEGIIAIGFSGVGIITITQFGIGIITIAQFGIGFAVLAQFGAGVAAMGQIALGIILAIGQAAIGFIAVGYDGAVGYYSASSPPDITTYLTSVKFEILSNPRTILIYSAIWMMVFLYTYMSRNKFIMGMRIIDFFKPELKHSKAVIRMKAISKLTDNSVLSKIAKTDPSDKVRKAAIKRITDESILQEFALSNSTIGIQKIAINKIKNMDRLINIAKKIKHPGFEKIVFKRIKVQDVLLDIAEHATGLSYRIFAISKLTVQNSALLVRLLELEQNSQAAAILLDKIILVEKDRSRDILHDLAKNASSDAVRIAAIHKLSRPDKSVLTQIAQFDISNKVCYAALDKLGDTNLIDIINSDARLAVKIKAVEKLESRTMLKRIIGETNYREIREAAEQRLNQIKFIYYALKVEVTCPDCRQPVFINGPLNQVTCNSCLSIVTVDKKRWKTVFNSGLGSIQYLGAHLHIQIHNEHPHCSACGELLNTDDIETGTKSSLVCHSCNAKNPTFPAPRFLKSYIKAEQVFCGDDGEPSSDTRNINMKPVAISCIKCGAPLEVTVDTPRNATCTYCNTVQYLPDPLWLSIHPVIKLKKWYVRCNFKESKHLQKLKRM